MKGARNKQKVAKNNKMKLNWKFKNWSRKTKAWSKRWTQITKSTTLWTRLCTKLNGTKMIIRTRWMRWWRPSVIWESRTKCFKRSWPTLNCTWRGRRNSCSTRSTITLLMMTSKLRVARITSMTKIRITGSEFQMGMRLFQTWLSVLPLLCGRYQARGSCRWM